LKNKEIIMEEQTFNYLVIEDGVVVNRTVGTIDTSFDNWIKETYPVLLDGNTIVLLINIFLLI